MPHLLLYGPPGTGKTSTILACARKLYKERDYPSMVLEVNNNYIKFIFLFDEFYSIAKCI